MVLGLYINRVQIVINSSKRIISSATNKNVQFMLTHLTYNCLNVQYLFLTPNSYYLLDSNNRL